MDDVDPTREEAVGRAGHRGPRGLLLSLLFPVGAWAVGGMLGLAAAVVIVAAWWAFAPRTRALWLAALVLLALAPVLLLAQGLPHQPVVGSSFGTNHLLAHRDVVLALLCAAFAALVEVAGLDAWLRSGLVTRLRRPRLSPTSPPPPGDGTARPGRP